MNIKGLFACGVIVMQCCGTALADGVLSVPLCTQEQTEWCWAGVSQSIFQYYGIALTQSNIAMYGTEGLNVWNWLYGSSADPTRRGINMIMNHWGISESHGMYLLTRAQIQSEIGACQPFVIRWGWDSGGGHFVVGRGILTNYVHIMDPWPGNGYTVNTYAWMTNGGGHTWTHTLTTVNTMPGVAITNDGPLVFWPDQPSCLIAGTNNAHAAGMWWSNVTAAVGGSVVRQSALAWTADIAPLVHPSSVIRVYATNGWSVLYDETTAVLPEPMPLALLLLVNMLRARRRCAMSRR